MKTYALAAWPWAVSTWLASGAWPRLAPPVRTSNIDLTDARGAALVYVCLHGLKGQRYWYGADWSTTVSLEQIARAPLHGSIVFVAGCWGLGHMSSACLIAGAKAVVGCGAEAWCGYVLPLGSNALGAAFVRRLRAGQTAGEALDGAITQLSAGARTARDLALLNSAALLGERSATLRRGP